jgi:MFS family permease
VRGVAPARARQQLRDALLAGLAAMTAYVCMYAFRRPFAAATFDGLHWLGLDYKAWLVMAQIFGYFLSKLAGIKFISEMQRVGRGRLLLGLIAVAGAALFGFAVVPAPWNIVFLFLNGLPLGLVWGVLFSYLEGRRATEMMGAIMASSLIFASGFTKTVARWLLAHGVSEFWMPLATGVLFVPLLLACVALLERLPAPDAADRAHRGERVPMSAEIRRRFARRFLPGIALMVLCYVALTVVRDFRDSFEIEVLTELGYGNRIGLFAQIETPIALALLVCTASLMLVRDNLRALMCVHAMMFAGVLLAGVATLAFALHALAPIWWLGLIGLGLYLAYVPFTCAFEERLVATFQGAGNVGFMMYLSDACGYLGSIGVVVLRESGALHVSWTGFLSACVLALSALGAVCVLVSAAYFSSKARRELRPSSPLQIPAGES